MRIDTPKINNLTSNGFVKTYNGDGSLQVDTTTYEAALTFISPLRRDTNDISLTGLVGFGSAGQTVVVNATADGLEYATPPGG